jgi:hypothetical protein
MSDGNLQDESTDWKMLFATIDEEELEMILK